MGMGWTLVADYFKRANFKKTKTSQDIKNYFPNTKAWTY